MMQSLLNLPNFASRQFLKSIPDLQRNPTVIPLAALDELDDETATLEQLYLLREFLCSLFAVISSLLGLPVSLT